MRLKKILLYSSKSHQNTFLSANIFPASAEFIRTQLRIFLVFYCIKSILEVVAFLVALHFCSIPDVNTFCKCFICSIDIKFNKKDWRDFLNLKTDISFVTSDACWLQRKFEKPHQGRFVDVSGIRKGEWPRLVVDVLQQLITLTRLFRKGTATSFSKKFIF